MPELLNLPCFGSPTAFLHHWHMTLRKTRNGPYPTRCGNCPAREGCGHVAKNHLRLSHGIRDANLEFEAAGGEAAYLRASGSGGSRIRNAYSALYRELRNHGPVPSSNDERVRLHVEDLQTRKQEQTRKRQAAKRKRDRVERLKRGDFDQCLLDELDLEGVVRRAAMDRAANSKGAPRNLTRGNHTTSIFTVDVWKAKTLISLSGVAHHASNVAHAMKRHGYSSDPHNVLRSKVERALKRVVSCETFVPAGSSSPIWPLTNLVALQQMC